MPSTLPYKLFTQRHPEYLCPPRSDYWMRCRALYEGGSALLDDPAAVRALFPRKPYEEDDVYRARLAHAAYVNYAGSIISGLVTKLFSERLTLSSDPEADAWYTEFEANCAPPGSQVMTFNELLKRQMLTALVQRRAWSLVDWPAPTPGMPPAETEAEEEERGQLGAWATPVAPENVYDWRADESGALVWALLGWREQERFGLDGDRRTVVERWTYYTQTEWRKYRLEYDVAKPPGDNTEVPLEASGSLSAGRVPLVALELPHGLYAMGVLEPLARAHFSASNDLGWACLRSQYPILVQRLESQSVAGAQMSGGTAGHGVGPQILGIGRYLTLGSNDILEYVGPDTSAFALAAQRLDQLRDEMYRCVHKLAEAADNSSSSARRSGFSKELDADSETYYLRALGQLVSRHALELLALVGRGRGDPKVKWTTTGMQNYDVAGVTPILQRTQMWQTLGVKSPTAERLAQYLATKRMFGDDASAEVMDKVWADLERNVTEEEFMPVAGDVAASAPAITLPIGRASPKQLERGKQG
jgi:hypothetical protein